MMTFGNYTQVYENQKNDVHPPFYYLILRFAMFFTKGHFSKWGGIVLNIIIYIFITIFMYLILKKLLKEDEDLNKKSMILAFISSITLSSISNVIYIRMYALLTLNILITTYLHIKLAENENIKLRYLIGIGIVVLLGILTHYYYLFYLFMLYLVFLIKYIKAKKLKSLIYYTSTIIISGIISLIIFPYSIYHIFFGYRGKGVISNLESINKILKSLLPNIHNLNYYAFNNLMFIILFIIVVLFIYNKIYKNKVDISKENKEILKIIGIPSIFFFLMTAISSPWKVLRYIVPVCSLIFVLMIYYLYKLFQASLNKKASNLLISILLGMILLSPFIFKLKPELLYENRGEIVQKLDKELNLPTIYFFNSKCSKFLEDILLFSKIDESYIAKNINYTEDNIKEILKEKDISKGIIIFISDLENSNNIIQIVMNSIGLKEFKLLDKLNSSNVYYLK
ncbi:MAG: glycosyltransferase family 39 protein [Clostridia bacterium]|nr:glycosyltransferase family 39 protein [Clostridia bacterium]